MLLLRIWIRKSRAFYAKVRPDKLAEQILLVLVLYSLQETGVIGTNIQFAVRSAGSGHFSHRRQYRADHGRPGGNRRASLRVRRVTLCIGTETTDPATDGLRHAVSEFC